MESKGYQESTTTSTWPTDEQLLLDFQQGDQAAFATIVERHEVRLARIAYRIVGCRHEAEDARHAVFVRFLQQIGQSRQLERVGAWLTRCTVNEAITRARQRNREGHMMAELATLARTAVDLAPSVQQQADESREQLSVALAKLTPDSRAILSLRFDEDLTFREVAELMERPASTVKSQVSHAIAQLRELLGASR